MNFWDFINKYNGKYIDYDKAYGNQCVDLFRQFCKEVLEMDIQARGVNGAKDFWKNYDNEQALKDNFEKISNTPDFVPWTGDIAIFYNGNYGHISICTGQNSNTSIFESFDQNWPTNSVCKKVSHNYKNFYGVLRPKNQDKVTGNNKVEKVFAVKTNIRENHSINAVAHLYKANTTVEILEENVANENGYMWDKVYCFATGRTGYVARTQNRYK